jgi:hypothetical protein
MCSLCENQVQLSLIIQRMHTTSMLLVLCITTSECRHYILERWGGWWVMNWKGFRSKRQWLNQGTIREFIWRDWVKPYLSQESLYHGQNSNSARLEYKPRRLLLHKHVRYVVWRLNRPQINYNIKFQNQTDKAITHLNGVQLRFWHLRM